MNDKENFVYLQDGIKKIQNFIHSGKYNLGKAITDASKAAYLATLLRYGIMTADKYNIGIYMEDWTISKPLDTKLNKLKKTNTEAFYYWHKVSEIIKKHRTH